MSHWHHFLGTAAGVGLVAALVAATHETPAVAQTIGVVQPQVFDLRELNCGDGPCAAVVRGALTFVRRNFKELGSNGRACSDCHIPSENFQLSPAAGEGQIRTTVGKTGTQSEADDPLFRPVDADDFRVNGDAASDFTNLVENGLVRVTMPLPLNVRLIDPATGQPSHETSVDLWRAVMPLFNLAITGPDFTLPIWPPGAPRVSHHGPGSDRPESAGRLPARRTLRHSAGAGTWRVPRARGNENGTADAIARRSRGVPANAVFFTKGEAAGGGDPLRNNIP